MKDWKNLQKWAVRLNAMAWIGCGFLSGMDFRLGHTAIGIMETLLSLINGYFFVNRKNIYTDLYD